MTAWLRCPAVIFSSPTSVEAPGRDAACRVIGHMGAA